MALRALPLATEKGAADVQGTLEVLLNGKPVEELKLTSENNGLLHQFVFKGVGAKAIGSEDHNTVEICARVRRLSVHGNRRKGRPGL
jgi:hypothetical protein